MAFEDDDQIVDLEESLVEQVGLLRAACRHYDLGDVSQAKVIAEQVSCLCYDGKRTKSLLSNLSLKRELQFLSAMGNKEYDLLLPLAHIDCPAGSKILTWGPRLGVACDKVQMPFDVWWNETIFRTAGDYSLTRAELVASMRNQDGSHVSKRLKNQSYAMIRRKGSRHVQYRVLQGGIELWGSRFGKQWKLYIIEDPCAVNAEIRMPEPQELKPIPNAHLAMMRHIGWELDCTISNSNLKNFFDRLSFSEEAIDYLTGEAR